MVKGKWAAGIPPRHFTWVIQDRLAVSERPGGFAPNHRRVRRHEEILWLQARGFSRIVSLLPSPHNLQAYDDEDVEWSHYPLTRSQDPGPVLLECFRDISRSLRDGRRILVHQEELGDRVMGAVAGFLVWSDRLRSSPQAVTLLERQVGRQMGSVGRELVVVSSALTPTGGTAANGAPTPLTPARSSRPVRSGKEKERASQSPR